MTCSTDGEFDGKTAMATETDFVTQFFGDAVAHQPQGGEIHLC
jgi:hypothetical protein